MSFRPYCILDDNIWVKAASLPAKTSKYFDVWKQGSESSDGDGTLLICEQFDGVALDTDKWEISSSVSSYAVENGYLSITGIDDSTWETVEGLKCKISLPANEYMIEINNMYRETSYNSAIYMYGVQIAADTPSWLSPISVMYEDQWTTYSGRERSKIESVIYTGDAGSLPLTDTDYNLKISKDGNNIVHIQYDGTENISATESTTTANNLWFIFNKFSTYSFANEIRIGTIIVRKYAAVEPVVITRDMGSFYRVYVYNDNDEVLTDFQFAIPASDLGVTAEESLEISESPSDAALNYWAEGITATDEFKFEVSDLKASETRTFVLVKEDGYSPEVSEPTNSTPATVEPTVSIVDKTSYYLITVTENDGDDQGDYWVVLDPTDISLSSTTESLEITEVAYYPSNYWIEATDGKTYFVVPEFLPFETQTWAVYKEEGYEPSIVDTMVFGYDFRNETTIDTSRLTVINTASIVDGQLVCGSSTTRDDGVQTTLAYDPFKYVIEASLEYNSNTKIGNWGWWLNDGTIDAAVFYADAGGAGYVIAQTRNDSSYTNSSSLGTGYVNTPIIWKIRSNTTSCMFYVDDVLVETMTTTIPDEECYFRIVMNEATGYTYTDWMFIRKYAAVEPTVVVTDMGTWWKVTITNNVGETLTNYQVAVSSADLDIGSVEDSLMIVQMDHGVSNQPYKDLFEDCVCYHDYMGNADDVMGNYDGTVSGATLTTDAHGISNAAYECESGDTITWSDVGTVGTKIAVVDTGSGWTVDTSPSYLSATGISGLTGDIAADFIFSTTLTSAQIAMLTVLLEHGYPYPIMNDTVGGLLE